MEKFLLSLLKIESLTSNTKEVEACMNLFAKKAKQESLKVVWNKNPRYVIIGRGDLLNPDVGMLCHVDVVSPFFPPHKEGERLHGRGVMDMKGPGCAAFFGMLKSTHPSVAMAITGDEETGGKSAAFLSRSFSPKKALLVPDQNKDFNLTLGAKGVIHAALLVKGKRAHGARPWEGENAVEKAYKLYDLLKKELKINNNPGWNNTLNLAFIKVKGKEYNVIPEEVMLGIDFRFINKSSAYWKNKIEKCMGEAKLRKAMTAEPVIVNKTKEVLLFHDIVVKMTGRKPNFVQNFGTCDARWFVDKVPSIILTRPVGSSSHIGEEWAEYASLVQFKECVRVFLDKLKPR